MTDSKSTIDELNRELAAAHQENSKSAAYGLELLNEKEKLKRNYESLQNLYDKSRREYQELKEAWDKAVEEQRISATSVFEKEVQLLNDSDALEASLTHAKQDFEKELKQIKSQLEIVVNDKDRCFHERDELMRKVNSLELEKKNLKNELKELEVRERKVLIEISELGEENLSLQKQVSTLRGSQVEFESFKHDIKRLQEEMSALNSTNEELVTLRRIAERQAKEAYEALQSEREQKYALRKELDKKNNANPSNWTSLAALKGSPHLANLALRGLGSSHRSPEVEDTYLNEFVNQDSEANYGDLEQPTCFDYMRDLEMPSIEGSLFDEVHLGEIKKLQKDLEEKENQRSVLNTKLIDIQHKFETKSRQAGEIEKKLAALCYLIEKKRDELDRQKESSDISSNENSNLKSPAEQINVLDDYDNVYSHLVSLFAEFETYREISASAKANKFSKEDLSASESTPILEATANHSDKRAEDGDAGQSDDIQNLKAMLYKKNEQLKQLRTVLKSNKDSAEVALANLKSKYDMGKALINETLTKLRLDHNRLQEDQATYAARRSEYSAREEEYKSEIEKLNSKLAASEQEKTTLNSILRLAIEQKVMMTQKLEALEMDREDSQAHSRNRDDRGGANKNHRPPRNQRSGGGEQKR